MGYSQKRANLQHTALPRSFFQPAAEEEDRRAGGEQRQLETDVSTEHAAEESHAGHDQPQQLQGASGRVHGGGVSPDQGASEMVIFRMGPPCSIPSTASCPATTRPKTV